MRRVYTRCCRVNCITNHLDVHDLSGGAEHLCVGVHMDCSVPRSKEEIETAYQDIDKLYRSYQTDKVLLTDKMRQDREDEIIQKEKDVKELQQQRFGTDGDLYKKQEELIRPIQNLIYNAIQEFSEQGRYGIIFDKSSDLLMLYADENLDKSEIINEYIPQDEIKSLIQEDLPFITVSYTHLTLPTKA